MPKNMKKNSVSGQGLVEYALIIVLVSGVTILSLNLMGLGVREAYCSVVEGFGDATGCGCSFGFDNPSDLESWEGNDKFADSFTVENGKACIDGKGKNNASFLNSCSTDFGSDDFNLSLDDLQVDEIYKSSDNDGYDVWFRAQDEDNGYHFTYSSKNNIIRFWKRVNGKWILLSQKSVKDSDWLGTTYNLEIKVEGDVFTAYKDGEAVLQAQDKTYTEGAVGLRTKPDSKTCVDQMSVKRP